MPLKFVTVTALLLVPSTVQAQPPKATSETTSSRRVVPIALGIGAGWQQRKDYGNIVRGNFIPEAFVDVYLPAFVPHAFWRIGGRLGYSGLTQADYPTRLSVRETEARVFGEIGLVYDWVVVPALSIGIGAQYRQVDFDVDQVDDAALDNDEFQPVAYVQWGVGLPFRRGLVIVEPYARYERIRRDARSTWMLGFDVSIEL